MARVSDQYIRDKKKRILQTVKSIWKYKSISNMTMQDIIDRSGLSQGGIYRYYRNLDEILADFVSELRNEIDMKKEIDTIRMEQSNLREKICNIFELLINWIKNSDEDILKITFDLEIFSMDYPERAKTILDNNLIQGSLNYLREVFYEELVKVLEKGELKSDFGINQIIAFISAAFDGIQMESVIARKYRSNKIMKEAIDIETQLVTLRDVMLFMIGV